METPDHRRRVYLEFKKLADSTASEINTCKARIVKLREQQLAQGDLVKAYEDAVCDKCGGHGRVRKQIAQDEIPIVTCDYCHGTGLPSTGQIDSPL